MDKTISLLKESIKTNANIIPKIGNKNCNHAISINVFLNKECKNAMNLTDLITVSLEDLDYSRNNGFIAGVTNIFTNN